ncbi:MAG: M42 family metallopeptidase [Syntrophothermus sp.]
MFLKELSEAAGVSGTEHEVRNLIRELVKPYVEDLWTDSLGNLIAVRRGTGRGKHGGLKVMVAAHMDEVGLMVTLVDKGGLVRFEPVGGLDQRVLNSKVVSVGPEKLPGVLGSKPAHLQKPEERKRALPIHEMYIDIGAKSKEEAERMVKVGDVASFATRFEEIGNGIVKGKAFDDRAGCALLIELLKKQYSFTFYGVFTVQEETGLRGAGVAAYAIDPDVALVLEGTTASDVPETEEHMQSTTMGKGPALTIMDGTGIMDRRLVERLLDLAERNRLPVQLRRSAFGGTDAGRIRVTRGGVPAAVMALPCRYIHSPVSLMSLRDWEAALALAGHFLEDIEKGGVPS